MLGTAPAALRPIILLPAGASASTSAPLLPISEFEQQQMHELMNLADHLHPILRTIASTFLAPDPSDHAPPLTEVNFDYIGRLLDAFVGLNKHT
jgi:hypothetical protein